MKKAKIRTTIGVIYNFSPSLNGNKFPTYKQVEKYLDQKSACFDIGVQNKKTLTDNTYRLNNAEARYLAQVFDKHPKKRWHDGMNIEIHYTLNKNGLHLVESAQKYIPPKKLTKQEKKSLSAKRTKEARMSKSQAKSTAIVNSQRNSIMNQVAGLQQSAIYVLSEHQKTLNQVKNEFKRYKKSVSNIITSDSTLFNLNQIQQIAKNNTPASTANNLDLTSGNNSTIQNLAMRANIQTFTQPASTATSASQRPQKASQKPKTKDTSHSTKATNKNRIKRTQKQSESSAKSKASTNNTSQQAKSIAQVKSQVAKIKKSQVQIAKSHQALAIKKASQSISASGARVIASKEAQAKSQIQAKEQKIANSNSTNNSSQSNQRNNNLNSNTESSNVTSTTSTNNKSDKSNVNSKSTAQMTSKSKPKSKQQNDNKSQPKSTAISPMEHLNHLMQVHNSVQERQIQHSYQHILHQHDLSHSDFRKAIKKIYKEEHWNQFFKNNEESTRLQVNDVLSKVLHNPGIKYSLHYNHFPNMSNFMTMTKFKYNNFDSNNSVSDAQNNKNHDSYDTKPQSNSETTLQNKDKKNRAQNQSSELADYQHKSEKQLVQEDKEAHARLMKEREALKRDK